VKLHTKRSFFGGIICEFKFIFESLTLAARRNEHFQVFVTIFFVALPCKKKFPGFHQEPATGKG